MNNIDFPQYVLIVLLSLYCVGGGISIIRRIIHLHRVNRMTQAIRDRVACNGHLIPPDSIDPRAYDIGGGYPEYVFIEERNDTFGERLIFISKDCKHINVMPWRASCDGVPR